jgi:hypothetical protein
VKAGANQENRLVMFLSGRGPLSGVGTAFGIISLIGREWVAGLASIGLVSLG